MTPLAPLTRDIAMHGLGGLKPPQSPKNNPKRYEAH